MNEKQFTGMLTLVRPIKVDGVERTELPYDFEALSGRDLLEISRKLKADGVAVTLAALDMDFCLAAFCKAVQAEEPDLTRGDVLRMGGRDTMRAAALARDFLLVSEPGSAGTASGE